MVLLWSCFIHIFLSLHPFSRRLPDEWQTSFDRLQTAIFSRNLFGLSEQITEAHFNPWDGNSNVYLPNEGRRERPPALHHLSPPTALNVCASREFFNVILAAALTGRLITAAKAEDGLRRTQSTDADSRLGSLLFSLPNNTSQ